MVSRNKLWCRFAIEDKFFIVDSKHKNIFENLSLRVRRRRTGTFHILVSKNRSYVYLGRILHQAPAGYVLVTKIIDELTIDFRKKNIKFVTVVNRLQMSPPQKSGKTSKYKGVYFCKKLRAWRAIIQNLSKKRCLGVFTTEEDAAEAYNKAALSFLVNTHFLT